LPLLLPFTLMKGDVGENARLVLRGLLGLFHALLDCLAMYLGRR